MHHEVAAGDIIARLTAPGAPFEMETVELGGIPCRIFKTCPRTLTQLYRQATRHADRVLAVEDDRQTTFREALQKSGRLAQGLETHSGVTRGQRIAIAMQNSTEWMLAFMAVTSLGAVAVLVNSRGAPIEMERAILETDCSLVIADDVRARRLNDAFGEASRLPRIVFTDDGSLIRGGKDRSFASLLEGWQEMAALECTAVGPEEPAVMMFTSGSTGSPKGAVLTHRSVMAGLSSSAFAAAVSGAKFAARLGPEAARMISATQPASLLVAPLFHVSGCHNVFLSALVTGGKIVVMPRWKPDEALRLIARERARQIACVPTMLWDLLRHPDFGQQDLSSLAVIGAGGARFPGSLLREANRLLPNAVFAVGYGLTETKVTIASASGDEFLERPDAVGTISPLADVEIVDDHGRNVATGERGEIVVRGAMLMEGYFGHAADSAVTFRDGWMHTGDIGVFDDRKRLYIVDRKKHMIISGGENIYCAEVETALSEHAGVREVVALGVPDARLGEKLVVVIVPQPDCPPDPDELRSHAALRLAAYKLPHAFHFRDQVLPRTHTDKIDRLRVASEIIDVHRSSHVAQE